MKKGTKKSKPSAVRVRKSVAATTRRSSGIAPVGGGKG